MPTVVTLIVSVSVIDTPAMFAETVKVPVVALEKLNTASPLEFVVAFAGESVGPDGETECSTNCPASKLLLASRALTVT